MERLLRCPRCGNENPRLFALRNGVPYCRNCVTFTGTEAKKDHPVHPNLRLALAYSLSKEQEEISRKTLATVLSGRPVFLHAVTGAGKTELVYRSMEAVLQTGRPVGFATPRKDVVIDLVPRIREAFPGAEVTAVYGGHTEKLEGDILVLTTHQLYRYPRFFGLLVVDEVDAFPYKGNHLLQSFFRSSLAGPYILLSATPEKEDLEAVLKEGGSVYRLFRRYHGGKLPVPVIQTGTPLGNYLRAAALLFRFRKESKPVFLFAPTIRSGKRLYAFLRLLFPSGAFVSSQEEERRLSIERFKEGTFSYLVTTSILERGVTVKNLQVVVFEADHALYTAPALIQISGRAGRKKDAREGEVFFLAETSSPEMEKAVKEIERCNAG